MHTYPLGARLVHDDDALMRGVFEMHPWAPLKIGAGIAWIDVRSTMYGDRGFYIVRVDGSSTDIGYKKSLSSNSASLNWKMVSSAFREAVRDQVFAVRQLAFADSLTLTCPVLGIEFDENSSAVDHIAPDTFDNILRRFGEQAGLVWETAITGSQDNKYVRDIVDEGVRDHWYRYHLEHARLRVISARANQLLGTRGSLLPSQGGLNG